MFMVIVNTVQGMSEVEEQRIRMAQAAGASKLQTVIKIAIPSSVPHILSGMRVGMSNAFGTAIGALFVGVLLQGLTMMNAPYYTQDFVKGAVLVVALVFTFALSNRAR